MSVLPVGFQWQQGENGRQYCVCRDENFIGHQIQNIGYGFIN